MPFSLYVLTIRNCENTMGSNFLRPSTHPKTVGVLNKLINIFSRGRFYFTETNKILYQCRILIQRDSWAPMSKVRLWR